MLNIANNVEISGNPIIRPIDATLGATAVAVYESWATELGVPLTGVQTGMGMIDTADNYQYSLLKVDLGFQPFPTIHNVIQVNTRGQIWFSSDTRTTDELDNTPTNTLQIVKDGVDYYSMTTYYTSSFANVLGFSFRTAPSEYGGILVGSRYQTNLSDAILLVNWSQASVAIRFNATSQSIDIYIEPNEPSIEFDTFLLDHTTSMLSTYTIPDSSLSGFVTLPALIVGNLVRIKIDGLPLATISGNVRETDGIPIIRQVSAINQNTKELKDTTMSDINGDFQLKVDPLVDYIVICEDTDISGKNALVYDRINVPL